MTLLDQSVWWLAPYGLLMLLMVHAMMEFTVSLLAQRPRPQAKPLAADALRRRLLALNDPDWPARLAPGKDCDLEISWEIEEPRPAGRFAIGGGRVAHRVRFRLDEGRHELRMHQVSRSHGFFMGLVGWLPRVSGYAGVSAGPPGEFVTRAIAGAAMRSGWTVRPVLWWFQATHPGVHFLEALTPPPLRRWPARRTWGIAYPLSFFLGMGYLVAISWPPDRHNLLVLLGISAGWWGVWGLLAWMLSGFPAFWRR